MTAHPVLEPMAIDRLLRLGGADLVRRLAELYLEQGPERLQALADGVARSDAALVERAAHTLKSTAGNVGASRLQHSAQAVEALAGEGVIDSALAARIRAEFEESAAALRRAVQELDT
jgi:HPt (histidine-containing phosphotransfer) domain-containing protein